MNAHEFVAAQFRQSIETPTRFFNENADAISRASFEMARRFERGGRLLVFGSGASATDAQHVSVEFVHPVIVGKRALPALALTNDIASVLGLAQQSGTEEIFARQLQLLGTPDDIALGIAIDDDPSVSRALSVARDLQMLTIAMGGVNAAMQSDFCFAVPSENSSVVQEVQETAYHILWETVHIFFEHKGLLEPIDSGASPKTRVDSFCQSCPLCSDEGLPGRVLTIENNTAIVKTASGEQEVALDLVDDVKVGDFVLVHLDTAIAKLNPADVVEA